MHWLHGPPLSFKMNQSQRSNLTTSHHTLNSHRSKIHLDDNFGQNKTDLIGQISAYTNKNAFDFRCTCIFCSSTTSHQIFLWNFRIFKFFSVLIFSKINPKGLNFKILDSDWSIFNSMLLKHFLCTLVSYSSRINRCPVLCGTARRRWGGPKES